MTLKVVPIRENTPLVSDIPGQLRQLADSIESGEVTAAQVLCIVPREDDWPAMYGWGESFRNSEAVALLELAKAWLIREMTP